MTGHEKALVASIAKLRGNGHMKMALDLENELRRLRASPVAKPKIAKTRPEPEPVDDDDDQDEDPDDTDDDEPEDAAPAKPKKTKHVEALGAKTFGTGPTAITLEAPALADFASPPGEFVMRAPDPRADLAAAINMPPALARGLTDRELIKSAPGWSAMTKAIEKGPKR